VVFVATPDHSHFAPSMTAVSLGIHCYTEKPLTWSVREAQLLAAAYKKNPQVVTQMGNQGHGGNGWRTAYEFIKAAPSATCWSFTPGPTARSGRRAATGPTGSDPVPETLDWDAWIGPAPMRPFVNGAYHSFVWRGVVDFGSGALGDMACHTTDGIYAIMDPGYAATAEPIFMTAPCKDQFPAGMTIKMTFRAKADRPGFTTYWYEGKLADGADNMPATPEELTADGRKLPRTGNLIIGTKGKMLVEGDYWDSPRLIPEAKMKEFGKPARLLERSPGHHSEFIQACQGDKPREFSQSNFGYSGPMTANIPIGQPLCPRRQETRTQRTGRDHERPRGQRTGLARAAQGMGPHDKVHEVVESLGRSASRGGRRGGNLFRSGGLRGPASGPCNRPSHPLSCPRSPK
jgi:hypothetical protein